jgi:simple sugar transport system permease protein
MEAIRSAELGAAPARLRPARAWVARLTHRPEAGAAIGLIGVFAFFAVVGGSQFLSQQATASWLNVASELGIVAIPVALLMIAGELDLSVGSVVGASSMTLAICSGHDHVPIGVGIAFALAVGALTGLANGVMVTRTRLPSFIVTLGTSLALSGAALGLSRLLAGTTSVSLTAPSFVQHLFAAQWNGQFNVSILWWLAISLVAAWVLNQTRTGNWINAVGGDFEIARAAGVRTTRLKVGLFMASGLGAALVGVIQTIEFNGSQVNNGQSFLFNSIIAVVVGGVLLTGGYGSVVGAMLGTLTFAVVNQGVFYTGWSADWALVILGGLLLAAVLANNSFRRLALTRSTRGRGAS